MDIRRQTDRAHVYWTQTLSQLSRNIALKQLASILDTEEWSYGFLSSIHPVEKSPLLLRCGPDCARALGIQGVKPPQLPDRYIDSFKQGCVEACATGIAVRQEGDLILDDGQRELFRAIFIPVELREETPLVVAFGTFNCKRTQL